MDEKAKFEAAVTARVRLIEQARKILPEQQHVALLEMTPRQIHEAVLKQLDDKLDLTGKSDAYVEGRFGHAIESATASAQPRQDAAAPTREWRTDRDATFRADPAVPRTDPAAAEAWRKRMDAQPVPWLQPLEMSKDPPAPATTRRDDGHPWQQSLATTKDTESNANLAPWQQPLSVSKGAIPTAPLGSAFVPKR
jgi:hypothetical protein